MGVYRMSRYTLATSILNRLTGLVLSLGLLLFVYWLTAVARGHRAYGQASAVLALPVFKLVYLVFIAAFSYHLIAGVRHLIWDTGVGLERAQAQRSAWFVVLASLALFCGLAWAFLVRAGA
jgi:succinate dehydrogenase / fumarate reductase cytochrome b subunit